MSTSDSLPINRNSRIEHVQTLRALAALTVVISHSVGDVNAIYPTAKYVDWLPGTFGVEIFFFISGFIICLTSLNKFAKPNATLDFYWHRFWRLVPLYWIATVLYLVISRLAPDTLNREVVSTAFVVGSFFFWPVINGLGTMSPVIGLGWSLNFEMFFYFVFGLLLSFPKKIALTAITVIFVILGLAHPLFVYQSPLGFWSRGYLFEFLAGLWTAVAFRQWNFRLPKWIFWPAVALLLGLTVLHFSLLGGKYALSPQTAALAIAIGLVGVFCAVPQRPGWVTRAFGHIGDASYSLYLVHMFTIRAMHVLVMKLHLAGHLSATTIWIAYVVASVGVALVTYRLIEKPAVKLGRDIQLSRHPVTI